MVVLVLGGILTPQETLEGFSSEAMITIACMFVLSAGLIRAGALEVINRAMLAAGGGSKVQAVELHALRPLRGDRPRLHGLAPREDTESRSTCHPGSPL